MLNDEGQFIMTPYLGGQVQWGQGQDLCLSEQPLPME